MQGNVILYAAISVFLLSCTNTHERAKQDILAANIDSTINPADDFFDYANGGWIKKNPIPAEESGWGIGNLVVDENLERLRKINEEAAKANAAQESSQQKIGDFWIAAMDTIKIEREGIKPLQQYFNKIDSVSDVKTLQNTM